MDDWNYNLDEAPVGITILGSFAPADKNGRNHVFDTFQDERGLWDHGDCWDIYAWMPKPEAAPKR